MASSARPLSPLDPLEEAREDPLVLEPGLPTSSSTASQLAEKDQYIWVEFEPDDKGDPFNFSSSRKWAMTFVVVAFTGTASWNLSSYAIGSSDMNRELGFSTIAGSFGIFTYALGFALAPLVLAPFSEEFGRTAMYLGSGILFAAFSIPVALAQNLQTVLIARFFAGCAGSTGSTMVGGTLADIWATHERGFPMSIFAIFAFAGTALGAIVHAWTVQNEKLGWRWIQWINLILFGALVPVMWIVLKETRATVILTRRAAALRKSSGNDRYRSRSEISRPPLIDLIKISATRPIVLLCTELLVALFSLWIGVAWALLYGLIECIPYVFESLYGFNIGQIGLVYISILVGTGLGGLANAYGQEPLYARNFARKGPEARLYFACVGGILFAVGCFIFAWTSFPDVHFIAPCIGLTILSWGIFHIYLSVFNYLADSYLIYASSALAGQSLVRNLLGAAFPTFIEIMYRRLNPRWASTLWGCLAVVFACIPFILFKYGPKIRAKSKFAKALEALRAEESAKVSPSP